jgi:hypothetical protein
MLFHIEAGHAAVAKLDGASATASNGARAAR